MGSYIHIIHDSTIMQDSKSVTQCEFETSLLNRTVLNDSNCDSEVFSYSTVLTPSPSTIRTIITTLLMLLLLLLEYRSHRNNGREDDVEKNTEET